MFKPCLTIAFGLACIFSGMFVNAHAVSHVSLLSPAEAATIEGADAADCAMTALNPLPVCTANSVAGPCGWQFFCRMSQCGVDCSYKKPQEDSGSQWGGLKTTPCYAVWPKTVNCDVTRAHIDSCTVPILPTLCYCAPPSTPAQCAGAGTYEAFKKCD